MIKKRYWCFELYPESCDKDWKSLLTQTGLPSVVSPLHDKDIYDKDIKDDNGNLIHFKGDVKKPHYHIILCYSGPTSQSNVQKITVDLLKGTIPLWIENLQGYYEYLIHKNNPEKYQYNIEDLQFINGFLPEDYFNEGESVVVTKHQKLINLIYQEDISTFSCLVYTCCNDDRFKPYFKLVLNNSYFYGRLIADLYSLDYK